MKIDALRILVAAIATTFGGYTFAWNGEAGEQGDALSAFPDPVNGMEIYDACVACHQPEGWGIPDGTVPQLSGQHPSVLIKQLSDIRTRRRSNSITNLCPHTLPEAIGDAQALADVAAYMAILPMDPEWGKGPWESNTPEHAQGGQIYKDNCMKCHGAVGMGDAERFLPRINGQHYEYMLRQIEWIRGGKCHNANPDMVEQTKGVTDGELLLAINYVSWQPVPKDQLAELEDYEGRVLSWRDLVNQ